MRLTLKGGLVAVATLAVSVATAAAGPIFDEPPGGDAGNSLSTAEDVKTDDGTGPIGVIKGELKGTNGFVGGYGDYQDLYRIFIADPAVFSAETFALDPQVGLRDPMLYLFDEQGRGIAAMNNLDGDNLQATLVNSSANGPLFTAPGVYYLAITSAMSEATVLYGDEIVPLFEMGLQEHQVGQVLPHGAWAGAPLSGWTPPTDFENVGLYEIGLSGVESLPVPAPAGLAILGLAAFGRRRRR
ncbi:MAG: hypothetical protein QGG74_00375 [Phycisphaerales bacterium]|jgi:MYXO-CTERM domain-containing protein|nr:hypothetical protein [Phycisphaerales bacterium]